MSIAVEHDPVAEAERLGPVLRDHAAEADRHARLPATSMQALRGSGFFRLYVPRALGGAETDPLTYARAQEELARHDAAAAWTLQAAGSSAWWCSRLPADTVDEIYRDGPTSCSPSRSPCRWTPPSPRRLPAVGARQLRVQRVRRQLDVGHRCLPRRDDRRCARYTRCVPTCRRRADHPLLGHPRDARHRLQRCRARRGLRARTPHLPYRRRPHARRRYEGPLYRGAAMLLVASYIPAVALGIARDALDEATALAHDKTPFVSATTFETAAPSRRARPSRGNAARRTSVPARPHQ